MALACMAVNAGNLLWPSQPKHHASGSFFLPPYSKVQDLKIKEKKKPKIAPEKKEVMPGMPRPDVPLREIDPQTFMKGQDRAWLGPENMVGVRTVRVSYGRYLAISKSMTSFLRGWKRFHGKPSPPFHPEDLSVDFWMLVQYLQRDIAHVTEREVLEVVKGSDTRHANTHNYSNAHVQLFS